MASSRVAVVHAVALLATSAALGLTAWKASHLLRRLVRAVKLGFLVKTQEAPFENGFRVKDILQNRDDVVAVTGTFPDKEGLALLIIRRKGLEGEKLPTLLSNLLLSLVHHNDVYTNYEGNVFSKDISTIHVTVIHPATDAHIRKHQENDRLFLVETKEIYQEVTKKYIDSIPPSAIEWVYNILEGKKEVEDVILREEGEKGFVLLPDMKWAKARPAKSLYCLALCLRRDIRSLRDLRGHHISLLENIRDKCLQCIEEKFGLSSNQVRVFVHYLPSYYHFHIHFTHWSWLPGVQVEKAHLLENIINNLKVNSNYYEEATIPLLLGNMEHAPLIKYGSQSPYQNLFVFPSDEDNKQEKVEREGEQT